MSSNPQPQWAVVQDDSLFRDESRAERCLRFLIEDGEDGYGVYRVTPQASDEEVVCRCAPTPSALRPSVSYDALVDWVARIEVTVKPVGGVVAINAESMADAFAEFLGVNGIEVYR